MVFSTIKISKTYLIQELFIGRNRSRTRLFSLMAHQCYEFPLELVLVYLI
jgi:hypothetical protein